MNFGTQDFSGRGAPAPPSATPPPCSPFSFRLSVLAALLALLVVAMVIGAMRTGEEEMAIRRLLAVGLIERIDGVQRRRRSALSRLSSRLSERRQSPLSPISPPRPSFFHRGRPSPVAPTAPTALELGPIQVHARPAGHSTLNDSADSRYWGFSPRAACETALTSIEASTASLIASTANLIDLSLQPSSNGSLSAELLALSGGEGASGGVRLGSEEGESDGSRVEEELPGHARFGEGPGEGLRRSARLAVKPALDYKSQLAAKKSGKKK